MKQANYLSRLLLLLSLLFGKGISLFATCDCEKTLTPEEAYEQADFAFVGKVVATNTNWIAGGWKFSFQVEKTWKRNSGALLIINTGWENQECGYLFEEGKSYLVYVKKEFTPRTAKCMGNLPLEEAGPALAFLGPGQPPSQSSMVTIMYWTIGILVGGAMAFLAFVVLRRRVKSKQ